MKKYLINIDLAENIPYYTITLKAKNRKEAIKKGKKICKKDYPEYTDYVKILTTELTPEEDLFQLLLI